MVLLAAGCQSVAQVKPVDTPDALARIRQIAKEDSQSYERLLARASPLAQEAYKDKKWDAVEAALKSAGLEPVVVASHGNYYAEYRCVLLPNAVATKGGSAMDLYLQLAVGGGRSEPTYAVPPNFTVMEATVGLSGTILAEHDRVIKEQWFGAGTIVGEALSAWPITNSRAIFPGLESADISFGSIRDASGENAGQGYRLQLVLAKGKDQRQGKRHLECSVAAPQKQGQGWGPVMGWLSHDDSPPGAGLRLAEDLHHLLETKEPSHQRLLRNATHIVQQAVIDRDWSAVSGELNGQSLKVLSENTWDFGMRHTYLVQEKAFTTSAGQGMDLFVEIETRREISKITPTREVVSEAYAGLSANIGTTYGQALHDAPFGKDSAIHRALLQPEAGKAAGKYPILNGVEVYYDVIGDMYIPLHSWGFFVDLNFRRDKENEVPGETVFFTVPSRLDLPERDDSAVLVKDFVSSDTLDVPDHHGDIESPGTERQTSFFLTKKDSPRWRKTGNEETNPVLAFGIGDLQTLPRETSAIKVKNNEVYDDDLAMLARFTDLQVLDLGECPGITDNGLRHLQGLTHLKSLTLSGEVLTGSGFSHLHALPELKSLTLYSSQKLTDQGIAKLAAMKQLSALNLHWASMLTDDQLSKLTGLNELRELHIGRSERITDTGLRHISTLANLESLTFSHATSITPRGIAYLSQLKNLRDISMGYMPLTDDAMKPLSQIESLEYVEIHGLKLTDRGIHALGNLARLKRLYLDNCPDVTIDGVNKLIASLKGEYMLD